MIRAIAAAFLLMASPAMAQTKEDAQSTLGLVHASFARIYCGMAIPDLFEIELARIADKNGWDRREFAKAIADSANHRGLSMTYQQRDMDCAITLRSYRQMGLQR